MDSSDVLFIGKGKGAVSWYRTGLPAFALGCDWVSHDKAKGSVTGWRRAGLYAPLDLSDYKIVVYQQPHERRQLHEIREAQRKGTRVLYEVDDHLHSVRKMRDHAAAKIYTKKRVEEHEMLMGICDGLIVSTEYLRKRYRKFNPNVYVCQNGVMSKRVADLEIPERPTINIGWAGGEGHWESTERWMPAVERILDEFPETRFVSIGLPVAEKISPEFQRRAVALPGCSLENFPAALTNFDIAIGPAAPMPFFYAKSDLRWLETATVGVPLVGDPHVYASIEDGVTGMHADTPEEAYEALRALVQDATLRRLIGENARSKVAAERDIEVVSVNWIDAFMELVV